jgi:DNA-directed RNA polymerase specialized sigma24 family protein
MGSMTTQLGKPTFDVAYEDWRPRLYRALVLATGDRDLALEAVDDAFSRSGGPSAGRAGRHRPRPSARLVAG